MKRTLITTLLFTALTATWAQNATNSPIGLFKITEIKSDSIEIDLNAANLDQYMLCSDTTHAQMAVTTQGIFAIEQCDIPKPIANGEYETRILNYDGRSFRKQRYNKETSSQIFPANSWITETWSINKTSKDGYDIIKCLKAQPTQDNALCGVWMHKTQDNVTYYRAYSKAGYVTIAANENKYIGELTRTLKTKKDNYYRTEKDKKVFRAMFGDANTMRLICTTDQQGDTTLWQRTKLPAMIEEAIAYVTPDILTDSDGIIRENKNMTQPQFNGGVDALRAYLRKSIEYPAECRRKGIEGQTVVNFVIKADGGITNIKIIKSSGDILLDQEAERVISLMPKWQPATLDGKPVATRFTMPVSFKLK